MSTMIHLLVQVATRVQSGWADIIPGEHPDSADELHYEVLKGLV